MSSKLVEVKNLTKRYRDGTSEIYALDDVSFDIKEGESLAIIGPSGSGKTTLLEIMAGLNQPTSGDVLINGKNIHKGSDNQISEFRNKTLGFVFQMMHLQDYFTSIENVTLPLIAAGVSKRKAQEKAMELLTLVGMEDRFYHFPKKLSGGEMQRVAIARALANNPKILMADEPTGKLDRKNADRIMDIFEEVARQGVSVVVITHDEKIAKRFPRVIELQHGKMRKI